MSPWWWLVWALAFGLVALGMEGYALRSRRKGDTLTETIQGISPHRVLATVVYAVFVVAGFGLFAWHLWWS